MHVVITGAAGFLGQRLARELLASGISCSSGKLVPVERLVLADHVSISGPVDPRVVGITGDISDPAFLETLITPECQLLFHLAAVVSSEAEADFDLGMRINVDASRLLLERCRSLGSRPRVVFTSSIAVFGPREPGSEPSVSPRSSYGTEKAITELLLADYSRRGFVQGVVLRLPTIAVRPGKPNRAASSFVSGIVREPLSGLDAVCPVPETTRLWLLSPHRAVANLVHAASLPCAALAANPVINLPGISVSVADIITAVERAGGPDAAARIRMERDDAIEAIVASWPSRLDDRTALGLGFSGDGSLDEIISDFVENGFSIRQTSRSD